MTEQQINTPIFPKHLLLSCQSPTNLSATVAPHFLFLPNFSGLFSPLSPNFNSNLQLSNLTISPVIFLNHLPFMEKPLLKSDTLAWFNSASRPLLRIVSFFLTTQDSELLLHLINSIHHNP